MREWTAARLASLASWAQGLAQPWRRWLLGPLVFWSGSLSIPASHRRWLHHQERAFALRVSERWSGQRWGSVQLRRWPVQPFLDLLNRPAGGHAYCGGPLFSDLSDTPGLRHFRGERCIDDPLLAHPCHHDGSNTWPVRRERLFWCGPVCHHFGHQIADFGSRALLASLDQKGGSLLWQRFGPGSDRPLQPWQRQLLDYINPGQKPIVWLDQPIRAERLVVIPQQARMRAAPTVAHLVALTWLETRLPPIPPIPWLYVSRTRFAPCFDRAGLKGGFAGELQLETLLAERGVVVLHPHECSVEEQLCHYRAARVVVVAEGSAQHGLELLGYDDSKKVVVICRRPQLPGMALPLQARFPQAVFVQLVQQLWAAEGDVPWNGLAVLRMAPLIRALAQAGLPMSLEDAALLEGAAQLQLLAVQQATALVRVSL